MTRTPTPAACPAGRRSSRCRLRIGIPALLCRAAGWPLPRRLPSLSPIGDALNGGWRPDDHFVVSVLAVVAWVVWAQIAAVALVRNPGRSVPAAGVGRSRFGLVPADRHPARRHPRHPRALRTPRRRGRCHCPARHPSRHDARLRPGGNSGQPSAPEAAPDAAAPGDDHVVRPDDTLWDLAADAPRRSAALARDVRH